MADSTSRQSSESAPDRPPKRQRRTRAQAKAETRQALLEAAAEVFSRQGFHGASLDEVAEHAGYTKGAVYSQFSGKDDLYLAVLEHSLRTDQEPPWTAPLESGASVASVAQEIESAMPAMVQETRSWAILTLEFFLHALRNDEVRERLAVVINTAREEYTRSLQRREEALGKPLPVAPHHLGDALLALENGMSIFGLLNPEFLKNGSYTAVLARLIDQ